MGISGGKDSTALLYLLSSIRNYRGFDFSLLPIHVAPGWDGLGLNPPDLTALEAFCAGLSLQLHREETQIAEIVFKERAETNPCSLCAKMRRGALHNAALALNCNKVALGHHADDVVETFFLNLFYNGKLGTFSPRTYLTKKNLVLIRPMVYLAEPTCKLWRPSSSCRWHPCPASGGLAPGDKAARANVSSQLPRPARKITDQPRNLDLDEIWDRRKIGL